MSFLKNWMRKGSSETPLAKRKREHKEGLSKQKERDDINAGTGGVLC